MSDQWKQKLLKAGSIGIGCLLIGLLGLLSIGRALLIGLLRRIGALLPVALLGPVPLLGRIALLGRIPLLIAARLLAVGLLIALRPGPLLIAAGLLAGRLPPGCRIPLIGTAVVHPYTFTFLPRERHIHGPWQAMARNRQQREWSKPFAFKYNTE